MNLLFQIFLQLKIGSGKRRNNEIMGSLVIIQTRNLHATAKIITNQYGGKFPKNFNHIKSLKGIGDYTASAIASICFDQEQAVVDGNVYRVLSKFLVLINP